MRVQQILLIVVIVIFYHKENNRKVSNFKFTSLINPTNIYWTLFLFHQQFLCNYLCHYNILMHLSVHMYFAVAKKVFSWLMWPPNVSHGRHFDLLTQSPLRPSTDAHFFSHSSKCHLWCWFAWLGLWSIIFGFQN